MTIETTIEILGEHARAPRPAVQPPPVVDPDQPLPVPLEAVPARSRAFLKVLIDVSEVTRACGGVLPSSLPALQERLGVPPVSDTGGVPAELDYWADERAPERRWGR